MTHTKRKQRRPRGRLRMQPRRMGRVLRDDERLAWDVAFHVLRHVADVFLRRAAQQVADELEAMRREPRPRLRVIRGGKS